MQPINQQNGDDRLLQRYLLGDLSEQEQDGIEELYFTDDDYLDKLLVAENELIDDYLRGKLSAAERRKFERNYLTTPEKRQRVQLVKQLRRHANEPAPPPAVLVAERRREQKAAWWQTLLAAFYPRHPLTRYAMAFGVLVVLFGGILLVNQTIRLRTKLGQAEQEKAALRRNEQEIKQQLADQQRHSDELAKALDQASEQRRLLDEELSRRRQAGTAVVPSFELGFEGSEPGHLTFGPKRTVTKPKSLVIPAQAKLVRLAVKVNTTGYRSYMLVLLKPNSTELWSSSELSPRATRAGQVITLHVPASLLNQGDYLFALRGRKENKTIETIKEYPVKVERR